MDYEIGWIDRFNISTRPRMHDYGTDRHSTMICTSLISDIYKYDKLSVELLATPSRTVIILHPVFSSSSFHNNRGNDDDDFDSRRATTSAQASPSAARAADAVVLATLPPSLSLLIVRVFKSLGYSLPRHARSSSWTLVYVSFSLPHRSPPPRARRYRFVSFFFPFQNNIEIEDRSVTHP